MTFEALNLWKCSVEGTPRDFLLLRLILIFHQPDGPLSNYKKKYHEIGEF